MLKKFIACCASLGAGLAILMGIGAGTAAGTATTGAIEAVARNPLLFEEIKELLIFTLRRINIPLIAAFIVAVILLIISQILCGCGCRCRKRCKINSLFCILTSASAGIAILGGIGAAIGLGRASAALIDFFGRQPSAIAELTEIFEIGARSALFSLWAAIIIAAGILVCLICSVCRYTQRITA